MNTYDFDQTIYEPDSSFSFFLYCMKKYPAAVLRTMPKTFALAAAYALKKIGTKRLKEQLLIKINVRIVEPKSIARSEGKAKRVIDLRKGIYND